MKQPKSRGHALARKSLLVFLFCVGVALIRIAVHAYLGAPAFVTVLGQIALYAVAITGIITALLHILMFIAYMSARRDRRRGHTTTGRTAP